MKTSNQHYLVEVSVRGAMGRLPLGLMNVRQALELPDVPSLDYSHPNPARAAEGVILTRQELQGLACVR
jgi:hypothetical protein